MAEILEARAASYVETRYPLEFSKLGPDVTEAFAQNGVTCMRGLLNGDWVERLRDWVEIAIENPEKPAKSDRTYIIETHLSARFEGFRDFIHDSPIAEAAATIMGSKDVRFYNDTIFVKEPSAPEPSPWHQDQPYCFLNGRDNCATWIPLDPADEASGAMTYAIGSHRWGKMFKLPDSDKPETYFDGPIPDIAGDTERYPTVIFQLEPGDVVFHHLMTLHRAGPNTTKGIRRRVVSNRFIGDDATWIDRPFAYAKFDNDMKTGDPIRGSEFPLLWPRA